MLPTAENIKDEFKRMLDDWEFQKEQVHTILCDNAANALAGFELASVNHQTFFIHTLHVVIQKGLNSQRSVNDLLSWDMKDYTLCKESIKFQNMLFKMLQLAGTQLSICWKGSQNRKHLLLNTSAPMNSPRRPPISGSCPRPWQFRSSYFNHNL